MKKTGTRKSLSLILALIMMISTLPLTGIQIFADPTYGSGEYSYILLDDGTAEIIEFNKNNTVTTTLSVPSTLGGHTVTSIGDEAFKGNFTIHKLTLPSTLKRIGNRAFSGTNLQGTKLNIPAGVEEIGENAFYGSWLSSVKMNSGLKTIGKNAFAKSRIQSAVIPSTVTNIGESAFESCNELSTVTLNCKATVLPKKMFYGCSALKGISIPSGVAVIGESCFNECGLSSLTISSTVTSIDKCAFCSCGKLNSVSFSSSLKSIGESAFSGCGFENLNLPDNLTSLGSNAFNYCESLVSVSIPGTLKEIASCAFKNCCSLTNVSINSGVKTIGSEAFSECGSLSEITIPDSVTLIGSKAFYYCTALNKITISKNIAIIESQAFSDTAYYNNSNNWEDDSVLYIGTNLIHSKAGYSPSQRSLTVKSGTKLIAENALEKLENLNNISIPSSVIHINKEPIYLYAPIRSASSDLAVYSDNCLITTSDWVPLIEEYTVLDNTRLIADGALIRAYTLETITIPASVKIIGENPFSSNVKTIKGYSGSYAETYAKQHKLQFVALNSGSTPDPTPTPTPTPSPDPTPISTYSNLTDKLVSDSWCSASNISESYSTFEFSVASNGSIKLDVTYEDESDNDPVTTKYTCNYVKAKTNASDSKSGFDSVYTGFKNGEKYTIYDTGLDDYLFCVLTETGGDTYGFALHRAENYDLVCNETRFTNTNWTSDYLSSFGVSSISIKEYEAKFKKGARTYTANYLGLIIGEEDDYGPSEEYGFNFIFLTKQNNRTYALIDSYYMDEDFHVEQWINSFPDVKSGAWYYDAVQYVAKAGYMSGYSNGNFGPGDNLKRQDFVVILANIAKADLSKYQNKTSKLKDVKKGAYYAAAVNWAVDNGIIAGYANGNFGVNDNITREQVATMLYRYMDEPSVSNVNSTLSKFSDSGRISTFAKKPVAWAVQNNIISGMADGRVAPTVGASRAQIASIIMRMDQKGMF